MKRQIGIRLILVLLHLCCQEQHFAQEAEERDIERAQQILDSVFAKHSTTVEQNQLPFIVVEAMREGLGTEHPLTLRAMGNAASWLREQGAYGKAHGLWAEIVAIQRRNLGVESPDTLTSMLHLAQTLFHQDELSAARQLQEEVLEIRRNLLGSEDPQTLNAQNNLAGTIKAQGDLTTARRLQEETLATRRRVLGPEHPDTLNSLHNLAATLRAQGHSSAARRLQEEVLQRSQQSLGASHPRTISALNNLADTLAAEGDLAGAQVQQEIVLELSRQAYGREHPSTLVAMNNLAETLRAQGNMAAAREYQERILDVRKRILGLESPDTLIAMNNLAGTLLAQGDLSAARQLFEDSLEIRRRLQGSEHPATLALLSNLAATLAAQGELGKAQRLQEKLFESYRQNQGPDELLAIEALSNVAVTLLRQGDLTAARDNFEKALKAFRRKLGIDHPKTLTAMHNLAWALQELGKLNSAQRLYEQIVEIRSNIRGVDSPPDTLQEAETLFRLGEIYRDTRSTEQASQYFLAAIEALDRQAIRLDPTEDLKIRLRGRYERFYRAVISYFLELHQPDEALHVLERYRARSLLALLRQKNVLENGGALSDVDARTKELARHYDAVIRNLERLDSSTSQTERRSLEVERDRLLRELKASRGQHSPPDSLLTKTLRVDEIYRHLDPGTVMLAYNLTESEVNVFVLTGPDSIETHSLSVSATDLGSQIVNFFHLLHSDEEETILAGMGPETDGRDARTRLGMWFFEKLMAPASKKLNSARRVLILPDGPLHYLPFNAIVRSAPDDPRGWQYLVEWKPIHIAQSATVYAELQKRRRSPTTEGESPPRTLVALGDPSYPPPRENKPTETAQEEERMASLPMAVRSAENRRLFELTRLPNTHREVTEIGRLFADAEIPARTYLGADATEERAKAELSQARYIHLAAHGLADPDIPDHSFIALTIPEGLPEDRDNGILQGWEIMDTLQLDADLVVLSACATAFGPNRGGEGLMSLSRAFQIAGARTVAASLWPVADDSTAELMIRFYRHLLDGMTKDEAMRAAQMELIATPIEYTNTEGETVVGDFRAPYHWAAFQLIGDWK